MICTIILLVFLVIGLGIYLVKHGQSRINEKYNFWVYLICVIIELLLYWGAGLFDNFK